LEVLGGVAGLDYLEFVQFFPATGLALVLGVKIDKCRAFEPIFVT